MPNTVELGVVEEGRLLASGLTLWVQNTAARIEMRQFTS
jgi:hypothetical protein